MTHNHPESIDDRSSPDEAAKSYEFYKKDVQILKETGVSSYPFQILSYHFVITSLLAVQLLSIFNRMVACFEQQTGSQSAWH